MLLVIPMLFSGCMPSLQPENQAYALSMSIDRTDEGLIGVGLLFSSNNAGGGSGSSGGDSGGGSEQKKSNPRYYAYATTFFEALDVLKSSTPRTLNMSQLQSVIFSQRIASEPAFKELIEDLILSNHLYGSANILVCMGSAKELLDADKPQVGNRLAEELSITLDHYATTGYSPSSKLASLYYMMNSIYGDPVAILAAIDNPKNPTQAATPGILGDGLPGSMLQKTIAQNEFRGSALIKGDRMVGVLDGDQTRWLQILTGGLRQFPYICQGQPMMMYVKSASKARVNLDQNPIVIDISMALSPAPQRRMPDKYVLEEQIRAELTDLISHCQSLGVDPFNYAEIAATRFLTIQDFVDYNWRARFQQATINLHIDLPGEYS